MIKPNAYRDCGIDPQQRIPKYAWPGGYPLYAIAQDGEPICISCVNSIPEFIDVDDPQWNIVGVTVNWEDPVLECASCNDPIECAYPPDEEGKSL